MIKLLGLAISFIGIQSIFIVIPVHHLIPIAISGLYFIGFLVMHLITSHQFDEKLSECEHQMNVTELPKNRMINELKMARRVQQALLTADTPALDRVNITKKCNPADNVGGDFYSFIQSDFDVMTPHTRSPGITSYRPTQQKSLGIVIGDVAGHGVSSALIMALSSGLFSEIAKRQGSPKTVLETANTDLIRYIENSQVTHVTAFYGVLDLNTYEFTYSRAGHPPALAIMNGEITELNSSGVFLGMFNDATFEEKTIQLQPGSRLFFYTDGITEAKDPDGNLFGEDNLKNRISRFQNEPIGTMLNLLFDDIQMFTSYQKASDDRSAVIVEIG